MRCYFSAPTLRDEQTDHIRFVPRVAVTPGLKILMDKS